MTNANDLRDPGKYFEHPLKRSNPLLLVAIFLALVLQVLGGVTREVCNLTLKILKGFTEIALTRDGKLSEIDRAILDKFPSDIRTVRNLFDLDASVTVWAACPTCSATYEPTHSPDSPRCPIYPRRCTFRRFSTSQPCNARLTKNGVLDGESVRVPIRPFPVQDFNAFVGRLLSQPEVEDALERGILLARSGVLRDISQGTGVSEMYDTFKARASASNASDLLLLWSLSVDWFNPFLNKAAGKSVSDGSIAMICVLLPPSLRLISSNVFLAGIIPAPEPSQEEVNHFLRPVVDKLVSAWDNGVWYTRTYRYPEGRNVYSAVALEVSDLPASRKIAGQAGHSAHCFCSLCHLKLGDINNVRTSMWRPKTGAEILQHALAWQDAPNKTAQRKLYKAYGVRWSELHRLPYWDPTKHVVIDAMHTLFLNIVQHHIRTVVGLDIPTTEHEGSGEAFQPDIHASVTENTHTKLEKKLAAAQTPHELEKFSKTVLWEACRRHGMSLETLVLSKVKKRTLASMLLVR